MRLGIRFSAVSIINLIAWVWFVFLLRKAASFWDDFREILLTVRLPDAAYDLLGFGYKITLLSTFFFGVLALVITVASIPYLLNHLPRSTKHVAA